MQIIYYLIDLYNTILDRVVFKFFNPYNVNPGGNCPVQAEDQLKDKNWYYFRARGSQWYLKVSKSEKEFDFDKEIFHYGDRNYKEWPTCGWLTRRECIRLATKALKKYFKTKYGHPRKT